MLAIMCLYYAVKMSHHHNSKSITLYENPHFAGRSVTLNQSVNDLRFVNDFNDILSSVIVYSGHWRLYEDPNFQGKFYDVGFGAHDCNEIYPKIGADRVSSVQEIKRGRGITLYQNPRFAGRELTLTDSVPDLGHVNSFQNILSAVIVFKGKWELCDQPGYNGRTYIVEEGPHDYEEIYHKIGNDRVRSVRKL